VQHLWAVEIKQKIEKGKRRELIGFFLWCNQNRERLRENLFAVWEREPESFYWEAEKRRGRTSTKPKEKRENKEGERELRALLCFCLKHP
jgi:hypothetical protein